MSVEEARCEVLIQDRTDLASGVIGLKMARVDGVALPAWEPGAHIDLVLPQGLARQYSLCGDPDDRTAFDIAVLREEGGRGGSLYVHERLHVGERLEVRGPRNHFKLVPATDYVFVAGGIGITPFMPMLQQLAGRGASWQLYYGGRTRGSMAFTTDLLARYSEQVHLWPQDESGFLDLAAILRECRPGAAVYCCGPEGLISSLEELAASRTDITLHTERFSGASIDPAGDGFTVELAQSGLTLDVPADRSLLEIVEAAGVEVMASCQEGTCGTCEIAVVEGEVDHRDFVLSEDERAQNRTMMICVSRARAGKLVIDL